MMSEGGWMLQGVRDGTWVLIAPNGTYLFSVDADTLENLMCMFAEAIGGRELSECVEAMLDEWGVG